MPLPDFPPLVQLGLLLVCPLLLIALGYMVFKTRALCSELRLRRYFEKQSPVGLALIDSITGQAIHGNPRFFELLEIRASDTSFNVVACMAPEDEARFRSELKTRKTVGPEPFKLRINEEREIWVLLAANRVTMDARDVCALLLHDITEQVELRAQIERAKFRLSELIRSLPDGLVIATPEGEILFASKAVDALKGIDQSSLRAGERLLDWLEPEIREQASQFIQSIERSGKDGFLVLKHQLSDGSTVWRETHGKTIQDPFTGNVAIVLSIRDVTKRMQAEEMACQQATMLQETLAKLAKLQDDMLSICAWTKKVHVDGKWVPVDTYLSEHLGLPITHSISEEAIAQLEAESGMQLKEEKQ